MPMSTALHKSFKDALKDEKHGDKNLIDLVVGYFDGDEGKEKVKKANDELIVKRDASEKEIKDLKEKVSEGEKKVTESEKAVTDKDSEIEKLKADGLSPEEKVKYLALKEKGMSPDVEAVLNRMEKDQKEMKEKFEASEKRALDAEEATKNATIAKQETDQANKIIKSLGTAKITKADNADSAMYYAKLNGLYTLEKDDNGNTTEKYYTKNDTGSLLAASIQEMADYVASKRENLVDSSGNNGSGIDHNANNQQGQRSKVDDSLMSLREQAAEEMNNVPT